MHVSLRYEMQRVRVRRRFVVLTVSIALFFLARQILNPSFQLFKKDDESFSEKLTGRVRKLEEICENLKSSKIANTFSSNFHELISLPSRKLIWCPVLKARSSNWMKVMFELAPISQV